MLGFLCARNSLASMPRLPITTLGPWVDPFGLGQDGVGVVLGQKVASDLSRFPRIKASGCHHTNPNLGPNRCTRKVVHFPTSAFPREERKLDGRRLWTAAFALETFSWLSGVKPSYTYTNFRPRPSEYPSSPAQSPSGVNQG